MSAFRPTPGFLAGLATLAVALSLPAAAQAPIERAVPDGAPAYGAYNPQQAAPPRPHVTSKQIVEGVWLRTADGASVQTVSANDKGTELRVEHGIANVTVHHAANDAQILVDLPGGQTSLVKDGLYTFNADTNTVRVLQGEADALVSGKEPVKVKEDHQFAFVPGASRPTDATFAQLRSDLLPAGPNANGDGPPRAYPAAYPGYAYGPYGDGFYAYPYYAYSPWAWGYPYGYYGYPYVGVGFGWGWGWGGGWGRGFRRW